MASSDKSAKKKPNFTSSELEVLLAGVEKRKNVLYGNFSKGREGCRHASSNREKVRALEEVAAEVSAVGPVPRTAQEIRKKKECWFSAVKRKASEIAIRKRQTGGAGPTEELSAAEERILEIIGVATVQGISGGLESNSAEPFQSVDLGLCDPSSPEGADDGSPPPKKQKLTKPHQDIEKQVLLNQEQILNEMKSQTGLLQDILKVLKTRDEIIGIQRFLDDMC